LPNVRNRPIGKNSPNLFTLASAAVSTTAATTTTTWRSLGLTFTAKQTSSDVHMHTIQPLQPALILISVLCSWHKTKSHIGLLCQSFMEWLNLEGIGDKKTFATRPGDVV
jgi:hypothetical protein